MTDNDPWIGQGKLRKLPEPVPRSPFFRKRAAIRHRLWEVWQRCKPWKRCAFCGRRFSPRRRLFSDFCSYTCVSNVFWLVDREIENR